MESSMIGGRRQDEDLMGEVARGDGAYMEPLIRRYGSPLLTFIRRMVGEAQSEDLFQDVFAAVWMRRTQYQYPRPFRPWLYTIAANKCRALLRWRRAVARTLEEHENAIRVRSREPDPTAPVQVALATETAVLVETAVRRLPEKQREVVVLRMWSGLSYEEIAQATGRRAGTVRSLMHHALAALREELGPRFR